ncbi:hypothetical protein ACL00T_02775 [Curtobacterium flaccumfaciens]
MTPRRRRGRPNVLSREQVIDAATTIANEDGLDRLSFRALGVRLGVAPMTVHRTIGGLDDLHAELSAARSTSSPPPSSGRTSGTPSSARSPRRSVT